MPRYVIVSGGNVGDWALDEIREDDRLIGADRGALFLVRNGFKPHLSIGDFDSVTADELAEIERASGAFESCDPVLKDYTDTEMAVERALSESPRDILMLGVLGSRFDHSLANVHLLVKARERGVPCRIMDRNNALQLAAPERSVILTRSRFTHMSLLPLTTKVTGVTLSGFRYPLDGATLTMGQSLGISNVLEAEKGKVSVENGLLLVIQSAD